LTNCAGNFCFSPWPPTAMPTVVDCCTSDRCVSFLA
jgi:hypothetical protein